MTVIVAAYEKCMAERMFSKCHGEIGNDEWVSWAKRGRKYAPEGKK